VKVVFDNLANFLSIFSKPNPSFCRLFAWSQLDISAVPVTSHPVLSPIYVYSVQRTCSHTHMYSTVCDQLCCEYTATVVQMLSYYEVQTRIL
jgi:hypothetical protein